MRNTVFLLLALLWCGSAHASENLVQTLIPNAQKVGEARLRVAFWDVYDATLYAPGGQWQGDAPYALSLHYLRELDGSDIADRSVEEMRKQGFADEARLAAWHQQMLDIFPDVTDGTTLTGVLMPNKEVQFFKGDTLIGRVKDPLFGQHFFNIWLAETSSEPHMRKQLLGML